MIRKILHMMLMRFSLIIKETGGSIRDALNLLEQVRFSDSRVTKEAIYQVLGHLDENRLLNLFEIMLYKNPADLLAFSQCAIA